MMKTLLVTLLVCVSFAVQPFFSPDGNVRATIIHLLQHTTQNIDIAIYSFTSKELALSLLAEKQKGRKIRIITDRNQSESKYSQIHLLSKYFPIRILPLPGQQRGCMHHKFIIIGNQYLVTGSYNWSNNAEHHNYENLIILEDEQVISSYKNEFNRLWEIAE